MIFAKPKTPEPPKPQFPVPPEHQIEPKKRHFFSWLKYKHAKLSKKQKWLLTGGLTALVLIGGVGCYLVYKHFNQPAPANYNAPVPPRTTEPSKLTGVEVPIETNQRPVTGVIIENSPDARPQSGLKDAGIIYEAIAEGGITRFLALYQETKPQYIGPVRSVRPYYLDWLMPFDASIAHVGGAPVALRDIRNLKIKDLDQFANPGGYWRTSDRIAPHNMYTSMAKLDALNKAKGFKTSKFTSFERKNDTKALKVTARTIYFDISGPLYNVKYTYVPKTGKYARTEGGAAHIDEKSKKRLTPKVVVAIVMSRGIASDGQHTNYTTTGKGRVFVFQDGTLKKGIWKKTSRKSQLKFLNADGTLLKLNAGQTWITIVDSSSSVRFTAK